MQQPDITDDDKYYTSDPQITFFKSIYRRHTPFIIENISIDITNSTIDLKKILDMDIIKYINIELFLPINWPQANLQYYLHRLINSINLEIESHSGVKYNIIQMYGLLSLANDIMDNKCIIPEISINPVDSSECYYFNYTIQVQPLHFPLCSVKGALLKIDLNLDVLNELKIYNLPDEVSKLIHSYNIPFIGNIIVSGFIFISQQEKKQFRLLAHEYVTRSQQFKSFTKDLHTTNMILDLQHFVGNIEWLLVSFTDKNGVLVDFPESFTSMEILFNKKDDKLHDIIESNKHPTFYRVIQPLNTKSLQLPKGLYMYSFCIKREFQPSGDVNMKKYKLQIKLNFPKNYGKINVTVYAVYKTIVNLTTSHQIEELV